MSKDIRSYFNLKSPANSQKKNTKGHEMQITLSKRRRPVVLIDSDESDDERNSAIAKRSKPLEIKEKKPNSKKQDETKVTTSKYFEKVDVNDFFGDRPVKRDNSRKIVKKVVSKEVLEFHNDREFEAELLKLDAVDHKTLDTTHSNGQFRSGGSEERTARFDDDSNKSPKMDQIKDKRIFEKDPTLNSRRNQSNSDEIPRKKLKLDTNKSSENEIICDIVTPPPISKNELLSNKSPTKVVSNNKMQKICTTKFFSSKKSQLSPSPPKKSTLFPDLSPKSSPGQKSPASTLKLSQRSMDSGIFSESSEEKESISLKKDSPPKDVNYRNNVETKNVPSASSHLWVERYKPSTTKQIIGQQGEKSCVSKLTVWLKNWYKNHSGNKKLTKPSPWAKNDDGAFFKAALLSGPPGVGKTTTAHLVAKELGFDVVEFNASDTRSKKLLHQEVSELLSSNSLSSFFTGREERVTEKHILLMDEVDGMAGNEDRGGVQELIQLIKMARIPIICMCNDRNHPKIRSLANYCFDLRFSKPRVEQIKGAMMSVCFKEKLKISPNDMSEIITSANQDIRLVINHLSMLSIEKTSLANSSKHIKMGPWDITRKVFSEEEHKSLSIQDKCDLFFHDYSVIPLFVQENYLNAVPHKPEGKNKIKKMELFARAARSLSLGDLTEKSIRSHNAWGLLPVQAVFSSLVPGDILEGHIGAQINFPAWFGKNSRQTKLSRMLQELTVHARLKISGNKEAMNLDYLVPLERNILLPLVTHGSDGIPSSLAVLSEYCLVREDLESFSELSAWPNTKNLFSEVESKVKAAFTRAYNKTSAPTPYAAVPIKKASKTDVDSMDIVTEEEEGATQIMEEDEEDEGVEVDAMIMVKKKPANKKVDNDVPSTSKGSKNSKRGRKK